MTAESCFGLLSVTGSRLGVGCSQAFHISFRASRNHTNAWNRVQRVHVEDLQFRIGTAPPDNFLRRHGVQCGYGRAANMFRSPTCLAASLHFLPLFFQRAVAAFRASSVRCSGVSCAMRFLPPFGPPFLPPFFPIWRITRETKLSATSRY